MSIKFTAKLKVEKVEQKRITKKDGGIFEFTEARLSSSGKKTTIIVARPMDGVTLLPGMVADMDIVVTSFETQDGRVFNNFLVTEVGAATTPVKQTVSEDSDIPF